MRYRTPSQAGSAGLCSRDDTVMSGCERCDQVVHGVGQYERGV